jgi:signal transduction histidine kinase
LEIRYQTEQKNRQIAEQSLSIAKRNQYLLLLSLFLGASLAVFWYYRMRQKQQLEKIQQQQAVALLEANMSGEQQERSRIAQELHDAIGGLLAAAKLHFAAAKNQPDNYEKGITILDEAATETRRLSHNLMPEMLLQKGLVAAVSDYTKIFGQKNDLDIDIQTYDVPLLSDRTSLAIYRIVQEALHNTLKHAAAKNVLIQLNGSPQKISLTIEDDGIGFDKNKIIKGLGLKNIEKRIAAMNGTIDIKSQKGVGTSFFIQLPNDNEMK